ncbi:hypothetical protein [Fimbriiglobus ruber]|uniref:hypothetical protein n=1 Tax=Fimbriiglobus ruber TaxID=1908690 RepID=UPI000B4BA5ED|nr:hypothetical protein [Fimbriiglobus ruber]
MTEATTTTIPDPTAPRWSVYRIDDNGNVFLVANQLDREAADRMAATFEARGHKQMYWVEEESR